MSVVTRVCWPAGVGGSASATADRPVGGCVLPRRYWGRTHALYSYHLKRWLGWCESSGLDPLIGVLRAHVELDIRHLGESELMHSSVVTMMHGARGFFRFAHIDGLISAESVRMAGCVVPRGVGLLREVAEFTGVSRGVTDALLDTDKLARALARSVHRSGVRGG